MEHHSPSDFNFQLGNWSLDTAYYVSSPSSLKVPLSDALPRNRILLKDAISGPIEQGRLAGWFLLSSILNNQRTGFIFRSKAADGGVTTYPHYAVEFGSTYRRWYRYTGDTTMFQIKNWDAESPAGMSAGVWRCYRVSWWNGYDQSNNPATVCRLEVNIDSVWYAYSDAYDTQQMNKGESIQRAGLIGVCGQNGRYNWYDDIEFYKAVET